MSYEIIVSRALYNLWRDIVLDDGYVPEIEGPIDTEVKFRIACNNHDLYYHPPFIPTKMQIGTVVKVLVLDPHPTIPNSSE